MYVDVRESALAAWSTKWYRLSLPDIETGAMGREIESRQCICKVVAFFM
jgi:hypothetical protein